MNTKLTLLYADAANYKQDMGVVLAGAITDDQIVQLKDALSDGEYLITDQVNLPTPSEKFAEQFSFPSEDDHVWTRLGFFDESTLPSASDFHTTEQPTEGMHIDELVRLITNASWDERAEMARLGIGEWV